MKIQIVISFGCTLSLFAFFILSTTVAAEESLPGTKQLKLEGDIASHLVSGVDRFLLDKLARAPKQRDQFWLGDPIEPSELEDLRSELSMMLGIRDARAKVDALEFRSTTSHSALIASNDKVKAFAVRWPCIRNMYGLRNSA